MQNDLISKSELLESLNDWVDENTDINTILRWIEEFDIAYDVEVVVSKMEKAKLGGRCDAGVVAIEIVRNGGKE